MHHKQNAQAYLQQQIEQADSFQQAMMLYDGAVRFLMQAKDAIGAGEIEARYNANRRAIDIVTYLLGLFDPATGGEVAKRMYGIHIGLLQRMAQIDFENDAAICDEVIGHLKTLRASLSKTRSDMQGIKDTKAAAAKDAPKDAEKEIKLPRHAVA